MLRMILGCLLILMLLSRARRLWQPCLKETQLAARSRKRIHEICIQKSEEVFGGWQACLVGRGLLVNSSIHGQEQKLDTVFGLEAGIEKVAEVFLICI
jgi:hypothetical protein